MGRTLNLLLCALLVVFGWLILKTPAQTPGTPPETTVPGTVARETVPLPPPPPETAQTTQTAPQVSQVEKLLSQKKLGNTAVASRSELPELEALKDIPGNEGANGYAFAGYTTRKAVNPIAAFWALEDAGLYTAQKDTSGSLTVPTEVSKGAGTVTTQHHSDTSEGARELMTQLLLLSGSYNDGFPLETRILGEDESVNLEQVHWSREDKCFYSYFTCCDDRAAYTLCIYLRSGDGKYITDVEFQLLHLNYTGEAGAALEELTARQGAALMLASELVLTGDSRLCSNEKVSFTDVWKNHTVKTGQFRISGEGEQGSLLNFRIRAAG